MDELNKKEEVDNIKLILELLPLIAFFAILKIANFFWATVAIMILTPIAITYEWYKTKKISIPPLITLALVFVFGTITLITKDSSFFQFKTTLLYILFALILIMGLAFKKNFLKMLMSGQINMPDMNWNKFAFRTIFLFLGFAVANELIRHSFSQEIWAGFKIVVVIITMIFMIVQLYLLSPEIRHQLEKAKKQD